MRRVVVTGMGIVCSLGRGREEVWRALSGSRRGFGEPTLFDRGGASKAPVGEVALPREVAPRGSR
ncbi:MAG TPA: beta-ketoacyl synthase N-terminal-like domain-containing protein, partial [Candidatus Saccharimonadales bacterium]|nr:beta-ketoacyl synthase N-terminal-like domain-containing protein [Candidatus Saccharimonadales bacterium]